LEETAVDLTVDFLQIFKAKYQIEELDPDVRLWLELLELVLLISYRHANNPFFSSSVGSDEDRDWQIKDPQIVERRRYWFSVRDDKCRVTEQEHSIYNAWNGFYIRSHCERENKHISPQKPLAYISPLFFTISAKIASLTDQGISERWIELAAQFMLHAALESLLAPREGRSNENPLLIAFAWGWIPPSHWKHYCESSKDNGAEVEAMINEMFKNNSGRGTGEHERWQESRLKHLSLFDVPPGKQSSDGSLGEQLEDIAKQYSSPEFEKKIVAFSKAIWELCRKPLLVQIEEGQVEGMSASEFEGFKKRIFPC
jgi:hypothetical protein